MKLREATELLKNAGVPDPRYDARELFIRIGGMAPDALISPDAECDSAELTAALERRAAREPLQYIIGSVGFYRETYFVSPDALIPRQDTEHLVDLAVKMIPEGKNFLDICTGSGCVAISVLKNTKKTTAEATDISEAALRLAERNAEANGVAERLKLSRSNALTERVSGSFYAILSNPPYVTNESYLSLEREIYFEPRSAFVADDDGMIFYKKILELYRSSLDDGGFFAFEIGCDQGEKIKKLADEHSLSCKIIKDYSDRDRVALLKK